MLQRSISTLFMASLLVGCGGPLEESEPTPGDTTTQESESENESTEDDAGAAGNPDAEGEEKQGTNNNEQTKHPPTNSSTNNSMTGDEVRLTSFHMSVFVEKGCTTGYCHGGFELGNPQDVIDAFVDVEAPEPTCGRTHYIVPGNPEESILWVRVRPITDEDVECEVVKMPNGSEVGLDEEAAQLIYDWISDGALL